MLEYKCHKSIHAEPMELGAYSLYTNWDISDKDDPQTKGYLVIYNGGTEQQHISWIPKEVFEVSYTETSEALTFGEALESLKQGKKVARTGWNGANQFVYYVPGGRYAAQTDIGRSIGDFVEYREYLALKTAQEDVATWSPSTSDTLATDWEILN